MNRRDFLKAGMAAWGGCVAEGMEPEGDAKALAAAKCLIASGQAGCALVRDGAVAAHAAGPGVKPILSLHDQRPADLRGAWVVDKVVGRAAAAIMCDGGAARVHGVLMSEGAKAFLAARGVPASADEVVPQILNRTRTGLCPLEDAVKDLEEPRDMVAAIRARIRELMAAKNGEGQKDKAK